MGIHDDLYKEGAKLGFAKGGQVKDTGNMPATKGDSQQEIEAGGRGKLRPGYKKGGYMKGGKKKGYKHVGGPNPEKEYPKSKAGKKMPKNVKARGGAAKMAEKGVKKINSMKTHNKKPLIGK